MMNRNISLTINAKTVSLTVDVRQSLLEVLREQGYTIRVTVLLLIVMDILRFIISILHLG